MPLALLLAAGLLAAPADVAAAADREAYEKARAEVGRDADAQVRLALWCEARGLSSERLKHLALAALRDPKHAAARGLMGMVRFRDQWARPAYVALKVGADADFNARLAEYHRRRDQASPTADAQAGLARWCEENGLDDEARAHHAAVLRLDPNRELSRRKLGYKKDGRRWVTDDQLAAEQEEARRQKEADRRWKASLTAWRGWLKEDGSRREEAIRRLDEVSDPRAVPSVLAVFARGNSPDRDRAVRLLGQIDSPASSRALAVFAISDASADIRRAATEMLKRRDPREFAGLLIGLLQKPIKFEVRRSNGPDAPGSIWIEGEWMNLNRSYALPAGAGMQPGDRISLDQDGLPVIHRPAGSRPFYTGRRTAAEWMTIFGLVKNGEFIDFGNTKPIDRYLKELEEDPWNTMGSKSPTDFLLGSSMDVAGTVLGYQINEVIKREGKNPSQFGFTFQGRIDLEDQIAVGRMQMNAQQRFEADAAALESLNESVRRNNSSIIPILSSVSGKDYGDAPEGWKAWWVDQLGYSSTIIASSTRPTFTEQVPLDLSGYVPGVVANLTGTFNRLSCFGAGTLVRTLDGSKAIETLKVGDRVLTQSVRDGSLGYHPITAVHHNPPSPTFLVKVAGDTIVSSPFHRFWVAGRGWVMARDLEGDETLRLLEGARRVESVEPGPVQPVFNLDVAGDHDFFAGRAAALVHDNSLPDTRLVPFDATPALAADGGASK